MSDSTKVKIGLNIGVDVITIIFILLLCRYNKILYKIQVAHPNKIEQALYIMGEPNYVIYLIFGAVFVLLLVCISIWDIKCWQELEWKMFVLILANVILLLLLIHIYSNPIFTSFVIGITVVGLGIGALGN